MANVHFSPKRQAEEAKQKTQQTATSPTMQTLARFGFAAKGVVYLVVGLLAVELAAGISNQTPNRKGALEAIAQLPLGKVLLGTVTIGLFLYALWSLILAVFDPEQNGSNLKGLIGRSVYLVMAISNATLAVGALSLVVGSGNGGKDPHATPQDWSEQLLLRPLGMALVVILGLLVLGLSCILLYRNGYQASFRRQLRLESLRPQLQRAIIFLGRLSFDALGGVFGIIGIFLIVAALQNNPHQVKGLGGALQTLLQQPFGQVLVAVVAAGLIAYGVYSFVEARYRRLVGS